MTNTEAIEKLITSLRRAMLDMNAATEALMDQSEGSTGVLRLIRGGVGCRHHWMSYESNSCPICTLITISKHATCCSAQRIANNALKGKKGPMPWPND